MVNASGPTDGKVVLRDMETPPESVAIIHCVGSRDENYHEYCSKVCCMYSLKFAHLIHERLPETEVYNCYIDMRTPGKGYEEFYHRLLDEGTHFIRGKVAEVTDAARLPGEEGKLIVQVEDTLIGKQRRIPVDMVILSPAMEARHDSNEISQLFRMGCDFDGFFIERHPKLDPVATMTEGIYIAGACQGPKDIPDSVVARCRGRSAGGRPDHPGHRDDGAGARLVLRRAVFGLPYLQQHVSVQRHHVPRSGQGVRGHHGSVPGLWHLCGGLSQRGHHRRSFHQRSDDGGDRRYLVGYEIELVPA